MRGYVVIRRWWGSTVFGRRNVVGWVMWRYGLFLRLHMRALFAIRTIGRSGRGHRFGDGFRLLKMRTRSASEESPVTWPKQGKVSNYLVGDGLALVNLLSAVVPAFYLVGHTVTWMVEGGEAGGGNWASR